MSLIVFHESRNWHNVFTHRPSSFQVPQKSFGPHSQSVFHDILQLFACTATIHSVMATAAKEQQKKFIRFLWRWKKFSFSIFLLFARDRRLSSSSSILITGIPWEKTTSYYIITEWIWRHWWQTSTDFLAVILRRILLFFKINLIPWKNDIPFNSLNLQFTSRMTLFETAGGTSFEAMHK